MTASTTWSTATIESLINDGVIIAHKDGNYGSYYPRTHEFGDEGVPFLTAKLLSDSGQIALSEASRLGFSKADQLPFGFIEEDDVLLSHNATIGRVAVVPALAERVLVGTSLTYYRVDPSRLLPRYLAAYFKGRDFQNQLIAVMSHSTRNQVPITAQRKLSVVVPPIEEQRRIADMLGSLDDKIELNRRMNETLETLARRLFKSWFVDFDPVHAKSAVRRQHPQWDNPRLSREALPSLDPKIAELFPDAFEESTLGPIPKGWKCGTFSNIAEIAKHSVTPGDTPDEEFHHYSIPAYDDGKRPSRELGETIKSNKFIVTPECVLLTKLNPRIPRVWLPFPDSNARSICSTEFLVLKPCPEFHREFVYSHVSSRAFFEVYETMVTGTSGSHQRIRPEHLLAMPSVVPPEPICSAFADAIGPFLNESESLRQASATLAATRDRLLPQLLSGEIQLGAA